MRNYGKDGVSLLTSLFWGGGGREEGVVIIELLGGGRGVFPGALGGGYGIWGYMDMDDGWMMDDG